MPVVDAEGQQMMHLWGPQGRQEGAGKLELTLQAQLGKGGFGAVYRVQVKARGRHSLADLRLPGPLAASLEALLRSKASTQPPRGAGGGRRKRNGAAAAGSHGGSIGGGTLSMALKLALPFELLSQEMRNNFQTAERFDANVQQRMQEEYEIMAACAASPHVVDAFAIGTVHYCGAWRPAILLEVRLCCSCGVLWCGVAWCAVLWCDAMPLALL